MYLGCRDLKYHGFDPFDFQVYAERVTTDHTLGSIYDNFPPIATTIAVPW